mmetsp:Transcript_31459/g.73804  ORF Transcript_31459/g.73804 Transcript_31459/m.73804 type:complete len:211 (-) Transcript_31459:316-948(-)
MMRTDRSTFSIGLTLFWTTVSVSVRSKLCVAATRTWREAASTERLPERDKASRRSMAASLSSRCFSSPIVLVVGCASSDAHRLRRHMLPTLSMVGRRALSQSRSDIAASIADGSNVTSCATSCPPSTDSPDAGAGVWAAAGAGAVARTGAGAGAGAGQGAGGGGGGGGPDARYDMAIMAGGGAGTHMPGGGGGPPPIPGMGGGRGGGPLL